MEIGRSLELLEIGGFRRESRDFPGCGIFVKDAFRGTLMEQRHHFFEEFVGLGQLLLGCTEVFLQGGFDF